LNPNDPNAIGDLDNVFGVKVVATTKIAVGTALVIDTTQAVVAWTRMGLRTDVNYYGNTEFNSNQVTFRVEERIAIGVPRPTAIAKVTGLGPS
jgi:HK97 family phage major capsid protein